MKRSEFLQTLLSTLRSVVPLLYLGQVRELLLLHHPRTSEEAGKGHDALRAWRKRCRKTALEVLESGVQTGTLAEFVKDKGYFHKRIVQNAPLLSLNDGEAPADIASVQRRMETFFENETTEQRQITAYYAPDGRENSQHPENAFFQQTLSLVKRRKRDGAHPLPIKAFRVGSLYLSQLAYDRVDAETFALVDAPYTLDPDEDFIPRATIRRNGIPTGLFVSTKDLSDRLDEFLAHHRRSGRRIEIW